MPFPLILRLAGTTWTGEPFASPVWHAVPADSRVALCGVRPQTRNVDWDQTQHGQQVDCPQCCDEMERLEGSREGEYR